MAETERTDQGEQYILPGAERGRLQRRERDHDRGFEG